MSGARHRRRFDPALRRYLGHAAASVELARHVAPGSIAVVLMDNAGWHRTGKLRWPANLRPLFIPPGCPELSAAENIWQFLRQTYLSNRVFDTYTDIVDAACSAWNKLLAEPGRITSIATRKWTAMGQ